MKSPIPAHNWIGRIGLTDTARFILTSGGMVYQIENQDLPGLAKCSGMYVIVSGAMNGNGIHISTLTLATE